MHGRWMRRYEMTRFHLYFDKDKETEWLNQMAEEGYAMDSFFAGFYSFSPCEKGEWQYQIDIGNGFFGVNKEYSDFMREMGIEIVQAWGPWVILRRKAQDTPFELYSDVESRIEQYKKILLLFKIVSAIELLILVYEVYGGVSGIAYAWPMVLIIAAVVCVFMNMIVRTKKIINELQERNGEATAAYNGRRVSPAVPAGLLLNSVNLLAADYIPTPLRIVLMVIALGLIMYGAVYTVANRNN